MNKRFAAVLVFAFVVAIEVPYRRLAPFPAGGDLRGPQIRSWDGTTLTVDWDGLRYQATCKGSTAWTTAVPMTGDAAYAWPRVTYPYCEIPSEWWRGGVWWMWDDFPLPLRGGALSLRGGARAARGRWVLRQEDFVITSVKAIGGGLFPHAPSM
jgi:hypothetical protein